MKAAVQEQERLAAEAQAALDELIRDGVTMTKLVKFRGRAAREALAEAVAQKRALMQDEAQAQAMAMAQTQPQPQPQPQAQPKP